MRCRDRLLMLLLAWYILGWIVVICWAAIRYGTGPLIVYLMIWYLT